MANTLIVVPCYNEAARFSPGQFAALETVDVDLLFVNDGSSDRTEKVLHDFASRRPAVKVFSLDRNCGKAEAVRRGFNQGLAAGYDVIGYADADLATPPRELLRLHGLLRTRPDVAVVMGARVKLLGTHIERRSTRHYLGRVFATAASLVLDLPVYDTQCGAKFFRRTPALELAMREPFSSRWAFDVELISRLIRPRGAVTPIRVQEILEVPLMEWRHVGGSKLSAGQMVRAFLDLLTIYRGQPRARRS